MNKTAMAQHFFLLQATGRLVSRVLLMAALAALVFLLPVSLGFGQSFTGNITGVVTDVRTL